MEVGLSRDLQKAQELGRVQRAFPMEGAAGMHRAEEAGATCASDRATLPRA